MARSPTGRSSWRAAGAGPQPGCCCRRPVRFARTCACSPPTASGSLAFPAPYHGSAPTELRIDGECSRSWLPAADNYARELEHFHDCVADGGACRTPAEQAARDVTLLTQLYRAAMVG